MLPSTSLLVLLFSVNMLVVATLNLHPTCKDWQDIVQYGEKADATELLESTWQLIQSVAKDVNLRIADAIGNVASRPILERSRILSQLVAFVLQQYPTNPQASAATRQQWKGLWDLLISSIQSS